MCDPISKPAAPDSAWSVHEALLALYDVLARYNAQFALSILPPRPWRE